ncbi:MAG: TIGR02646 family protein [Gallionella sp.]|nr:TIGR02646 family protein [Gallionella sp.]
MRFIQKTQSPDFFEQEKSAAPLTTWESFQNPCKNKFKDFLLTEQQHLCGYCECHLSSNDSHLEHLAPQEQYADLRFVYENLIVSCNGTSICDGKSKHKESCGHRKNNEYDQALFLNPVATPDISSHFKFDPDTGQVLATEKDAKNAANYMIRILNLDALYLRNARRNAKEVLLAHLNQLPPEQAMPILRAELATEREFISFLRFCFAPFLA